MPTQEFFFTPREQRQWLREVVDREDVWCFLRESHYKYREITSRDIDEINFDVTRSAGFQIYVGSRVITDGPAWFDSSVGPVLDILPSYAVQFYPSCMVPSAKTILKGYMAAPPTSRFPDRDAAKKYSAFFGELRKRLKAFSTSRYIIAQRLPSNEFRHLPTVLVGREVLPSEVKLEETLHGVQFFAIERGSEAAVH